MYEYSVEHAILSFTWRYSEIAAGLPVPGTSAFNALRKLCAPFGLTPKSYLIDIPSGRLDEAVVRLSLLDGDRLIVRFSYSDVNFIISPMYAEDAARVVPIADALFKIVKETDVNLEMGKVDIKLRAHWSLTGISPKVFINERVPKIGASEGWTEQGFAYNRKEVSERSKELQVGIALSRVFDTAIFVEIASEFSGAADASAIAADFDLDRAAASDLLQLKIAE